MFWNVKLTETGFEGTQLLLGNPMVTVDSDDAECVVSFYGEHVARGSQRLTEAGDPPPTGLAERHRY